MKELRLLAPTAILGYGFPVESFERGMELKPHLIGIDAGSIDPGPFYLGKGKSFTDKNGVKRDLEIILEAACREGIPVLIGTAGGSGAKEHLDWNEKIIEEIAAEKNLSFKLARIDADFSSEYVLSKLQEGDISPLTGAPRLESKDVRETKRIVGQMGIEPFQKALEQGAQVVLAGRAYDPVCFGAMPVNMGFDPGLSLHLGKILECAAIAAKPGSGRDCMFGILREDHFILHPVNPDRVCTPDSVAAHSLYEKSDPFHLHGPGGELDLTETKYEQVDERAVKVSGTKFVETPYAIKIEGARLMGYRSISIAGVRDPVMIENIEEITKDVKESVKDNFGETEGNLNFRLYGYNGVMGELEPVHDKGHELGIVIEAVASSQERANTILSFARSTLLHVGYEGRLSTAGNLAFPYSPSDIEAGEVYEFSMHHLVENIDPVDAFPIQLQDVGAGGRH